MKNLIVCSTCNMEDKMVTDFESGEIVCTRCGTVFPGLVLDARESCERILLADYREWDPSHR